jgi:hypothetical protein
MKILNNSKKRIPKVGHRIIANNDNWDGKFYTVASLHACPFIHPRLPHPRCRECESRMRLTFVGYLSEYCAENDWIYEDTKQF